MSECDYCGAPCAGRFCSEEHEQAWYRRVTGPRPSLAARLLLLLALLVSMAAAASDGWQAKCETGGGCMLITREAFDHLLGEIERLQRVIVSMRREQCA